MRTTAIRRLPAAFADGNAVATEGVLDPAAAFDCRSAIPADGTVVVVVVGAGAAVVVVVVTVVAVDVGVVVLVLVVVVQVVVVETVAAQPGSALQTFRRPPVATRPASDGRTSTAWRIVARSVSAG